MCVHSRTKRGVFEIAMPKLDLLPPETIPAFFGQPSQQIDLWFTNIGCAEFRERSSGPWLPGASQRTLCFSLCPTIKKTTSWGFSTPTCCSFGKPPMKYRHLHLQLGGRKIWSAKHKPTKNLHPARAGKNTAKGGSFQCQRLPSRSRPSSHPLG